MLHVEFINGNFMRDMVGDSIGYRSFQELNNLYVMKSIASACTM